ncbi:MAG: NAD(P)H-dependent oxidoreductase subunit E [Clostridia bacterium]|nr:NAD(P)H-dependent oxidoreductase subunit E [Clostridia bacterium]
MKVTVCIGSSCHLKGSRTVVERLKALIEQKALGDKVELAGTFCMGNCQKDVCVTVDDNVFSITPEEVDSFFQTQVVEKL